MSALFLVTLGLLALVPSATASFYDAPVTPSGDIVKPIVDKVIWVSAAIFLLVEVLLVYFLIKYRKKPDSPEKGPDVHGNTKLEIAWTIAPALIMIWLLVISFDGMQALDYGPGDENIEVYIDVVASQFQWTYIYPDGTEIKADPEGKTRLRIQEDTWVQFNITSLDVIHAFAVPDWYVIIDAMPCGEAAIPDGSVAACPGRVTETWALVREPGIYFQQCRQFCGIGHTGMVSEIEVFAAGTQTLPYGEPDAEDGSEDATAGGPSAPPSGAVIDPREGFEGPIVEANLVETGGNPWAVEIDPSTIPAGETVRIIVNNKGNTDHNLAIGNYAGPGDREALFLSETIGGGTVTFIDVTFEEGQDPAGFAYWCDVPGHDQTGMLILPAGGEIAEPLLPAPGALVSVVLIGLAAILVARRR